MEKKLWFGKKELVKFGIECCYLSQNEATRLYVVCQNALKKSIEELESYVGTHGSFEEIGSKMIAMWKLSQDEKTYKEMAPETK
ncbi:hypothetical protein [Sulfurimonas sp.]|uniref:hypothetical protein n=1 Tax=Sulfurimonas sp. TaxID=2022749 RepID=UPI0025F6F22D|nr:hypothetical protein [Sulfurimonas sp.]MBW6488241.1 hypothetical protein [Sulfurimonas sp.]